MNRFTSLFLTAAACLLSTSRANAQATEGTVSATGMVTLKQDPDLLRMQVELSVDGKELKDALARLKELQAAIKPQLITLGAADASITFTETRIRAVRADRRRRWSN